jgi:hypothetical protein
MFGVGHETPERSGMNASLKMKPAFLSLLCNCLCEISQSLATLEFGIRNDTYIN